MDAKTEHRMLTTAISLSGELGRYLDEVNGYEPPEEGDNPVEHEALQLSASLLAESGMFEDFARSIDEDPINGFPAAELRRFALCLLRSVDRYVAARTAYYGAPEDVLVDVPDDEDEDDQDDDLDE